MDQMECAYVSGFQWWLLFKIHAPQGIRILLLAAEPVIVFFDMLVYVVNSSVTHFEVCVNLRLVNSQVVLGERVIYVSVDPLDGDAIGEKNAMICLIETQLQNTEVYKL